MEYYAAMTNDMHSLIWKEAHIACWMLNFLTGNQRLQYAKGISDCYRESVKLKAFNYHLLIHSLNSILCSLCLVLTLCRAGFQTEGLCVIRTLSSSSKTAQLKYVGEKLVHKGDSAHG